MTEAEVIDRINSTIKKNGKNAITGEEMNFVLKAIIQLIADSGGVVNWGDIEGTIADQLDLASALAGKEDSLGFTPEDSANKGIAGGYAALDGGGKIPSSNLPSTVLKYISLWNPVTNSPALTNPDATKAGNVYIVSVAGSRFGISWNVGDWLIYNDTGVVEKSDNSDDIVSVNGYTGIVNLTASDVGAPSGSGTSTNTNTGDEDQASILSKLGIWTVLDQTPGTASSGISNTISKSIELPTIPNKLKIRVTSFRNSGTTNTFTSRIYLSSVNNSIDIIGGTAILIGTITGANSAVTFLPMKREFDIISGNITGFNATSSSPTDDVNLSVARLNVAIPTGSTLYLIVANQCVSAADTARVETIEITNF